MIKEMKGAVYPRIFQEPLSPSHTDRVPGEEGNGRTPFPTPPPCPGGFPLPGPRQTRSVRPTCTKKPPKDGGLSGPGTGKAPPDGGRGDRFRTGGASAGCYSSSSVMDCSTLSCLETAATGLPFSPEPFVSWGEAAPARFTGAETGFSDLEDPPLFPFCPCCPV